MHVRMHIYYVRRACPRARGVACTTTVSYLAAERSDGVVHFPVVHLQGERTARGTTRGPSRPAGARARERSARPPRTRERSSRRRTPRLAARSRLAGIRTRLFPAQQHACAGKWRHGRHDACLSVPIMTDKQTQGRQSPHFMCMHAYIYTRTYIYIYNYVFLCV